MVRIILTICLAMVWLILKTEPALDFLLLIPYARIHFLNMYVHNFVRILYDFTRPKQAMFFLCAAA